MYIDNILVVTKEGLTENWQPYIEAALQKVYPRKVVEERLNVLNNMGHHTYELYGETKTHYLIQKFLTENVDNE